MIRKSATTISVADLNDELKAHIAASRKKSNGKEIAAKKTAVAPRIPNAQVVTRKTTTKTPAEKRTTSKKADAKSAVRKPKSTLARKDVDR